MSDAHDTWCYCDECERMWESSTRAMWAEIKQLRERLVVAERERDEEHLRYIDAVVTANNRANDFYKAERERDQWEQACRRWDVACRGAIAQRDRLAEALRPFAEVVGTWDHCNDETLRIHAGLPLSDYRRVRAALAECAGTPNAAQSGDSGSQK